LVFFSRLIESWESSLAHPLIKVLSTGEDVVSVKNANAFFGHGVIITFGVPISKKT
jgi:hypothetical protein